MRTIILSLIIGLCLVSGVIAENVQTGHFDAENRGQSPVGTVPYFAFFDDFNDPLLFLGEAKWVKRAELKGNYSVNDGYLKLKDCSLITRNFRMKIGILEFKARADKNCAIQAIVRGRSFEHAALPIEQIVFSSSYPGAEHAIAVDDVAKVNVGNPIEAGKDYIYRVILDGPSIIFERYGQNWGQSPAGTVPNFVKEAEVRFLDISGIEDGYIGLKASSLAPEGGSSAYFDWVRVSNLRKENE